MVVMIYLYRIKAFPYINFFHFFLSEDKLLTYGYFNILHNMANMLDQQSVYTCYQKTLSLYFLCVCGGDCVRRWVLSSISVILLRQRELIYSRCVLAVVWMSVFGMPFNCNLFLNWD